MTQPKQPPPGVETTPQGAVVSLQEAAARLGKDPRTVIRASKSGEIRGGANSATLDADQFSLHPGSAT